MQTSDSRAIVDSPAPPWCRAALNYVAGDSVGGVATRAVTVTVADGRQARLPGWESAGFELVEHASQVQNWDDDDEIERVHYAEIAALAQALSGCDHALVAGHIRRNPEEAARHADLGPIAFVHSDFAASYGELIRGLYRDPKPESRRALERAGITAEAVVNARRLLILQFWRNTGPQTMDLPIAFCDARSVPATDLRTLPVSDYAGGGFDFDTLGVVAPEDPARHQWYGFPGLGRDEVVAFRTYDSARLDRGEPFWTPHSAFADPTVAPGRPSRRSIELRATCLFR